MTFDIRAGEFPLLIWKLSHWSMRTIDLSICRKGYYILLCHGCIDEPDTSKCFPQLPTDVDIMTQFHTI